MISLRKTGFKTGFNVHAAKKSDFDNPEKMTSAPVQTRSGARTDRARPAFVSTHFMARVTLSVSQIMNYMFSKSEIW